MRAVQVGNLVVGNEFSYTNHPRPGIVVIRNSDDNNLVIVEDEDGRLTTINSNLIVYINVV